MEKTVILEVSGKTGISPQFITIPYKDKDGNDSTMFSFGGIAMQFAFIYLDYNVSVWSVTELVFADSSNKMMQSMQVKAGGVYGSNGGERRIEFSGTVTIPAYKYEVAGKQVIPALIFNIGNEINFLSLDATSTSINAKSFGIFGSKEKQFEVDSVLQHICCHLGTGGMGFSPFTMQSKVTRHNSYQNEQRERAANTGKATGSNPSVAKELHADLFKMVSDLGLQVEPSPYSGSILSSFHNDENTLRVVLDNKGQEVVARIQFNGNHLPDYIINEIGDDECAAFATKLRDLYYAEDDSDEQEDDDDASNHHNDDEDDEQEAEHESDSK